MTEETPQNFPALSALLVGGLLVVFGVAGLYVWDMAMPSTQNTVFGPNSTTATSTNSTSTAPVATTSLDL
ncbi:MAG: hypothetical protein JWO43_211 [Candidatus Adlerbacteria bacterium]|nr:hypothetical protein [Candidatus Adlerbacteria bacterium]